MVLSRKLCKVRTIGNKSAGNLRPEISDRLPHGFNYVVHEYNETEGWCIVEFWCSNATVLEPSARKTASDLNALINDPAIIETLSSHPLSPSILGRISVTENLTTLEGEPLSALGNAKIADINLEAKTLKYKGKTITYKRRITDTDTGGRQIAKYIVDEG